MDWTIRKYAVHLQMDGSFMNGLKWQLDCIKSLLQNKGFHHCHLSPLPTTVAYYRHLLLSPIATIRAIAYW